MRWLRGAVLLPDGVVADSAIGLGDDGCIAAVHDLVVRPQALPPAGDTDCFADGLLVPGFVDVHVHGGGGADFMDDDPQAIATVLATHAAHGTTSVVATTLSAAEDVLRSAIRRLARFRREHPWGARLAGIHLEGPYLAAGAAGAQDPRFLRAPDVAELERLLAEGWDGCAWIVTMAPELPGALEAIDWLVKRGVRVSVGHTRASFEETAAAFRHGAAHATHLWNAMTPLHHRQPGAAAAALVEPGVAVELIADGHHVHGGAFALACRARAPHEVLLVTDAMRLAGLGEGARGKLLEHDVRLVGGAPRLADGTLAGSALTMERAVAGAVELGGVSQVAALRMASQYPAAAIGAAHLGRIAPGAAADLVWLRDAGEVAGVWVGGVRLEVAQAAT